MPNDTPPILPLPPHVAAQIKSSTAIPTLASVVLGLVANSLDAEAFKIDISVDFGRGTISIEDDGVGIPPREFTENGGLGRLHHTSKDNSQKSTHGQSGTFLASVAALSILTITSRHCTHLQHASLVLHHSRPAARLVPAPCHHRISNREHGTRVTVHDLFGNIPVRVRHRAAEFTNGEAEKQLEALKKQVVGLLLAWHRPVAVSLKDVENSKKLHIRGKEGTKDHNAEDESSVRKIDILSVCGILSQAGYIDRSSWDEWTKASARTQSVNIKGAISTQPAPSKQAQFISLSVQPITAKTSGNVLYDEINRLFALSSFGNQEDLSDDEQSRRLRRTKDKRFKQDGFTNKEVKGGGKGVDRWPRFYIHIELEDEALDRREDVDRLREGTLSCILMVLRAMITSFLEKNHFRPRTRPQRLKPNNTPKQMPSIPSLFDVGEKRPLPKVGDSGTREHVFSTWGRIKSGTHVIRQAAIPAPSNVQSQETATKRVKIVVPERDDDPAVASRLSRPSQDTATDSSNGQHCEQTAEWKNPITGTTVLINTRTGLVLTPQISRRSSSGTLASSTATLAAHSKAISGAYQRLKRSVSSPFRTLGPGSWSHELLAKWENPIFGTTETDISQLSLDGPSFEVSHILHGRRHCCTDLDISKAFKQSSSAFSAQLSKNALKRADIIAQVDQKFVLIRIDKDSSVTRDDHGQFLVLVDQHAADERIRVEGLLADLSSSPTPLAKPIIFEIPARETELLTRHAPYFADWGIIYAVNTTPPLQKCRLSVKALPGAIAERCRVEPKVLIEMLRGEAWKCEESGSKPVAKQPMEIASPNASKIDGWLSRLGSCPQGLLEMLNSRACRSAIMFNDNLTVSECQTLIRRLGNCAFPFQCAHGRPSMIPLLNLGGSTAIDKEASAFGSRSRASNALEAEFREAWKRWKPLNEDSSATPDL